MCCAPAIPALSSWVSAGFRPAWIRLCYRKQEQQVEEAQWRALSLHVWGLGFNHSTKKTKIALLITLYSLFLLSSQCSPSYETTFYPSLRSTPSFPQSPKATLNLASCPLLLVTPLVIQLLLHCTYTGTSVCSQIFTWSLPKGFKLETLSESLILEPTTNT